MKLSHKISIDENVITASINVVELGNSNTDADTELNLLHNFVKIIEYSAIDFKSNMKLVDATPQITSESPDDSTIEEVTIKNLINKKIVLDENFSTELTIDINKINPSEYTERTVFNSKELIGQCYAVLFINKIESTISEKLKEIKDLSNDIEKQEEVIL